MKTTFTTLKLPVILSLVLVLPFILMELINRREFHEDFPFSLFLGLWLLPLIFFLVLTPIVQRVREGRRPMENPVDLVFGILVMVLVAVMWVNLLADQMPCFLGVPNCD
jgi:hypothetical protein